MKKQALASLITLLLIKSVSACSVAVNGTEEPQIDSEPYISDWIFFISAFALIIPVIILFFLNKTLGKRFLFSSTIVLISYIPAIIFFSIVDVCALLGYTTRTIRAGFFVMLFIFIFHLIRFYKAEKNKNAELLN